MKKRIKEKQEAYATLTGGRSNGEKEVNFVRNNVAKNIAKKVATLAKNKRLRKGRMISSS